MSLETLHHPLKFQLQFHDRDHALLKVKAIDLAADMLDGSIIRCFLTIVVTPAQYRKVDAEALFNLAPEVRGEIFGGRLDPDVDVEMDAKLDPAMIFDVSMKFKSIEAFAAHLQKISQDQAEDPLLDTESWFGLYVKQLVALPPEVGKGQLKVGYRTTWAND